jgi:hypothetical protein
MVGERGMGYLPFPVNAMQQDSQLTMMSAQVSSGDFALLNNFCLPIRTDRLQGAIQKE